MDGIMKQPIEGLLYDLDLLPEQCKTDINNMRREVVEQQNKEIEWLVNQLACNIYNDIFPSDDMKQVILNDMKQALEGK